MTTLVPIRTASDGVRMVGPGVAAPAGSVFFSFDGVTAVVDPVSETPQLLVHDAAAAAELVADVFGAAVAQALDSADDANLEAPGTDESIALHRAGVLAWLSEVRPLPLDPELIALESAVVNAELPWEISPGLGSAHDLPDTVGKVVHLLRALRTQAHSATHQPLLNLARRALAYLPVGNDQLWPDLARERALLRADSRPDTRGEYASPDWLHELLAIRSAAHLGSSTAMATSLDWPRVPQQLVPAPEDSVVFAVESVAGGAGRLTVTIAASPSPRLHPALSHAVLDQVRPVASLSARGWPLPLATGPLALRPDGLAWVGAIDVAPDAMRVVDQADGLDLDVRSAHLPWRSPDPVRDARAMARRWAARGIAGSRLASAMDDPGWQRMAADGLSYAARLWRGHDLAASRRCLELAENGMSPTPLSVAESWLLESGTDAR